MGEREQAKNLEHFSYLANAIGILLILAGIQDVVGGLRSDFETREVETAGRRIEITPSEQQEAAFTTGALNLGAGSIFSGISLISFRNANPPKQEKRDPA